MKTVLLTGGTGLIGQALKQALLERGYSVIILTRKAKSSAVPNLHYAFWNINDKSIDKQVIANADHIIHLAGASVAEKRWTAKRKKEIFSSRVDSSRLLVESLSAVPNKIKTVISASAIGYYGSDQQIPNPAPFTEEAPADNHFLGDTCRQWEAAIEPVSFLNRRLVKYRIGIVLSREGGAYAEFAKVVRWGIAPILGNGKQVISWIHIDDLVRLFLFALENESMSGVFNAVAPKPVSNKEFILQIAENIKRRFFIPVHVPSFFLKLWLGEMSVEVLKSATVSPEKILRSGFIFQYPGLEAAVRQLENK